MARSIARTKIREWYSKNPTTWCSVVSGCVCRPEGCGREDLMADARCDLALKQRMASQRPADEPRPWLTNLRVSPDRRYWILQWPFDKFTLNDVKAMIPASDRRFDEATREWWVARQHTALLNALFANFTTFVIERSQTR